MKGKFYHETLLKAVRLTAYMMYDCFLIKFTYSLNLIQGAENTYSAKYVWIYVFYVTILHLWTVTTILMEQHLQKP